MVLLCDVTPGDVGPGAPRSVEASFRIDKLGMRGGQCGLALSELLQHHGEVLAQKLPDLVGADAAREEVLGAWEAELGTLVL
jgi:hypothetical protein